MAEGLRQYCYGGSGITGDGDCKCPVTKPFWVFDGYDQSSNCVAACPSGMTQSGGICSPYASLKNYGPPCPTCGDPPPPPLVGNPINPGFGTKFQSEPVLPGSGPQAPRITLNFNSPLYDVVRPVPQGLFGAAWSSDWDRAIRVVGYLAAPYDKVARQITMKRADGKEFDFNAPAAPLTSSGSELWSGDADVNDKMERLTDATGATIGWRYTEGQREEVELFDDAGRVLSITNRQGLAQKFTYAGLNNGLMYAAVGASPIGYVAPACAPPTGWAYQLDAATPPDNVSPYVGRLLCISDPYGRQLNFSYDFAGHVIKVADPAGAVYGFEYDGATGGCVSSSDGGCGKNNLTKVLFPDATTRLYYYNEASLVNGGSACSGTTPAGSGLGHLPNSLTGITDEDGTRFATWKYDCQGRATSSEHAGGVERVTLTYDTPSAGQTTVVNFVGNPAAPTSTTRVYGFSTVVGAIKNTGITDPATSLPAPCAGCGSVGARTYDTNGNADSVTDWNGNKTCFVYDQARNLATRRVEGLSSATSCAGYQTGSPALTGLQRMTSTVWSTDWRLPAQVAEPLRITTYAYGAAADSNPGNRGNLLSVSVQATADATGAAGFAASAVGAPRVTTYTYNANGKVLTVDGPRTDVSDVTTTTYYADNDADLGKRGNVATVTNALGQTTQITAYNAYGQPLTVVDPNGLTTQLAYDARQRLISRTVGNEVTSYAYDGVGQLTQAILPDSSSITYTHDAAHRLTGIADNLGNKISYTLDLQGNRTREDVLDPSNQLAQTRSRVYDALNRLQQDIGAQNQTTQYAYDLQGNLTTVTDPLSRVTTNSYDALNRLASMTQPAPAAGQPQPVIGYGYNGQDRLTQVTDPRNLVTSYAYDGLGNLNTQVSPDTGTTSNTYDIAGNILTSTDAKGQVTSYAYDALNRVTSLTYNQATGAQLKTVTYTYDQGTSGNYGIGRLTTATEADANASVLQTTQYAYDQRGRLASETRTLAGNTAPYFTSYNYDPFTGRLLTMTYPSGRLLAYSYDALGRISQIGTTAPAAQGGQTQMVVSSVTYQPFGGVRSYVRGNNRTVTRSYDQDGRIASYTLGGNTISVGYDTASRITSLLDTGNAANSNSYGYDGLDRLTSASVPATSYSYSYDLTGNRLSRGAGSATDLTIISPTSNRIAQVAGSVTRPFTYDPNGSTTADGNNTYTYDPRGRLVQTVNGAGTTTYQVSSQGQRVRKTSQLGDTVFHYDAQGKLIAETTPAGVVKKEYLYLLDIPVAVSAQQ